MNLPHPSCLQQIDKECVVLHRRPVRTLSLLDVIDRVTKKSIQQQCWRSKFQTVLMNQNIASSCIYVPQ